ncbi:hypothetical protein KHX94_03270 [Shewanella dokdonensis]|uniref:Uncharacterized protein n=1 Tax=Shewanella dokdonensis TaxID=712036 RepID=A0ABX8DID5_9GAMM|nr:hypothetical protein [Shewanella dokdonensis]QVK23736.1 hypothetical protein KHX94_03270 [Shewanella dokdonensis]
MNLGTQKISNILKSFISGMILTFFTRRTLKEHLKTLLFILTASFIFVFCISLTYHYKLENSDGIILKIENYLFDKLLGYLSIEKFLFIISTIAISFFAFFVVTG